MSKSLDEHGNPHYGTDISISINAAPSQHGRVFVNGKFVAEYFAGAKAPAIITSLSEWEAEVGKARRVNDLGRAVSSAFKRAMTIGGSPGEDLQPYEKVQAYLVGMAEAAAGRYLLEGMKMRDQARIRESNAYLAGRSNCAPIAEALAELRRMEKEDAGNG